mmetsp:Transcript_23586/g.47201  ORF Transcript_23586/g.47201 Transcript_23586/m.47201 type:complete len:137 (+) Transcript_23586:3459-3869(+)
MQSSGSTSMVKFDSAVSDAECTVRFKLLASETSDLRMEGGVAVTLSGVAVRAGRDSDAVELASEERLDVRGAAAGMAGGEEAVEAAADVTVAVVALVGRRDRLPTVLITMDQVIVLLRGRSALSGVNSVKYLYFLF